MKRTLTRILTSICVVAILVSCLGITAFADDTVKYTMKSGDTVVTVCNKLGVNFQRNQAWITSANHITNYNNIPVGKVLVLPLFDTVADPTRANKALADAGFEPENPQKSRGHQEKAQPRKRREEKCRII